MKKIIFISAACIAITVIHAQTNQTDILVAPPVPPIANIQGLTPPPPPPPPLPMLDVPPPPPPAPPVPPNPPVPPIISEHFGNNGYTVISDESGTETQITVKKIKGVSTIIVKKDGKTNYIKMDTWNKNKKYYESKYGELPPPPPPVAKIGCVEFAAPVIKQDN